MLTHTLRLAAAAALGLAAWQTEPANAQIRLVSMNTNGLPVTEQDEWDYLNVMIGLEQEMVGSIARAPDLLALQEQGSVATTARLAARMAVIYGPGTYAAATVEAFSSAQGRPGLIYNTQTLELLEQTSFRVGSSPRGTVRYKLRPVGYGPEADFYLYVDHFQEGYNQTAFTSRYNQATGVRTNAVGLGANARYIYAGDYRSYGSAIEDADSNVSGSQNMYTVFTAPGAGQGIDLAYAPGDWSVWPAAEQQFAWLHTSSPYSGGEPGFTQGGIRDRFSMIFASPSLTGGQGLSHIPGSYRVLGNTGDLYQQPLPSSSAHWVRVLRTRADALPVITDFQLPAKLQATLSGVPTSMLAGQSVQVQLEVRNVAPVAVPQGADRLTYTVSTSGAVSGGTSGVAFAASAGNQHSLTLTATSQGTLTGSITVTTSSAMVSPASVSFPISVAVSPSMASFPDFDGNAVVDQTDMALLAVQIGRAAGQAPAEYDLNFDGQVNDEDLRLLITNLGRRQ